MKTYKRAAALALVLLLGVCVFAACSAEEQTYAEESQSTETVEESSETVAEAEDVVGEVTYIGDSYFSLNTYEAQDTVSDYAALDIAELTEVGEMDFVYIYETTQYCRAVSGTLETVTIDDMQVGSLVAVTADEDENQQIIILADPEDETAYEEEADTTADAEETVWVAQLTGFYDDGSLLLTRYELTEDAAEYVITDYTTVETDNYALTEETEDYTIPEACAIYLIEDGIATEIDASYLIETDILVIRTDKYGQFYIYAYPAAAETTE